MGTVTKVHQRHIASSSSPRHYVNGTSAINGTSSPDGSSSTPNKTRRKRKRQRPLRPLLRFALCGMAGVLLFQVLPLGKWNSARTPRFELSWKDIETPTVGISIPSPLREPPQCSPLEPDNVDFTLVTQLSQDRLWMMQHHCQRFPHKISIAVYTNATLESTQQNLQDMGCKVQELVKVTVVDSTRVGSSTEYPVNLLRNLALQQVTTSHLIYIDVDFWTSEDLYEVLTGDKIRSSLAVSDQLAVVLPAFMLFRQCKQYKDCRHNNLKIMPKTKRGLLEMMIRRQGHIFDPTNRGGHGSTLYKEWIRQDPTTLLDISCLQSHRYEPFLIVRYCDTLPPFPTAFSGYGKNKLAWMMHLVRKGFALKQIGGAFCVHYPHLDSEARTKWNEAPDQLKIPLGTKKNQAPEFQIRRPTKQDGNLHLESFKRGQVDRLFVHYRKWLEESVKDETRVELCPKHQDDDTKLWIDTADEGDEGAAQEQEEIQKDNAGLELEAAAVHGEEDGSGEDPADDSKDGDDEEGEEEELEGELEGEIEDHGGGGGARPEE